MILKRLNVALVCLVMVISFNADAGLIESDVFNDSTNRGFTLDVSGYNYEWVDFGVFNGISYDYIKNNLDDEFSMWRIATVDDVDFLFRNMFSSYLLSTDTNQWFTKLYFWEKAPNGTSHSWMDIYSVMGFNTISENEMFSAIGIYDVADKYSQGYFASNGYSNCPAGGCFNSNSLKSFYGQVGAESLSDISFSTMLIKINKVPEPSTLAIFALGMLGLASRRFKKYN